VYFVLFAIAQSIATNTGILKRTSSLDEKVFSDANTAFKVKAACSLNSGFLVQGLDCPQLLHTSNMLIHGELVIQ